MWSVILINAVFVENQFYKQIEIHSSWKLFNIKWNNCNFFQHFRQKW